MGEVGDMTHSTVRKWWEKGRYEFYFITTAKDPKRPLLFEPSFAIYSMPWWLSSFRGPWRLGLITVFELVFCYVNLCVLITFVELAFSSINCCVLIVIVDFVFCYVNCCVLINIVELAFGSINCCVLIIVVDFAFGFINCCVLNTVGELAFSRFL